MQHRHVFFLHATLVSSLLTVLQVQCKCGFKSSSAHITSRSSQATKQKDAANEAFTTETETVYSCKKACLNAKRNQPSWYGGAFMNLTCVRFRDKYLNLILMFLKISLNTLLKCVKQSTAEKGVNRCYSVTTCGWYHYKPLHAGYTLSHK